MKRDQVIGVLKAHRQELAERFGVKSLGLFGSVVRDEAGDASDVDLLVEFDRAISLFDLSAVRQRLEEILGLARVDLVMRDSIFPELRDIILGEAIDVA